MKCIITESQFKSILEQNPLAFRGNTMPSDATQTTIYNPQKGGYVQSNPVKKTDVGYSDEIPVTDTQWLNVFKTLISPIAPMVDYVREKLNSTPNQVRLIFPEKDWEINALNYLKKLGIVTAIFTSVSSAIDAVKNLRNKKVVAKELVIGSHGDGEKILMSKQGDEYSFRQDFLNEVKTIISPNTTVFFTACKGADTLSNLVEAANTLGVGVYGASGIYNYITNTAQKGFYFCNQYKPKPDFEKRDAVYSGYSNNGYSFTFYGLNKTPKIKLIFSPSSLSKLGITQKTQKPITINITDLYINEADYRNEKAQIVYEISFNIDFSDFAFYEYGDEGFDEYKTLAKNKDIAANDNFPKNSDDFYNRVKSLFEENLITITSDGQNIKDIKPIQGYFYSESQSLGDNETLLKIGACKKVSSSPVSWV